MIVVTVFLHWLIYVFLSILIVFVLFQKVSMKYKVVVVMIFNFVPLIDYSVSEIIYSYYSERYGASVSHPPVCCNSIAYSGRCTLGGGCNIYDPKRTLRILARKDGLKYDFVELIDGDIVYAMKIVNGVVTKTTADKVRSQYVVNVDEKKFLLLLFRDKVIVDRDRGVEIARFRYIARFASILPFFSSMYNDSFLRQSDEHREFCFFEEKIIVPAN